MGKSIDTRCHKVKHPTWIDYYFTFSDPSPDIKSSYLPESLSLEDDTVIADTHQFGDERAIALLWGKIRTGKFEAPSTALLIKSGAPAGVQIRSLAGVDSMPLLHEGRVIGRYFQDSYAKYCILGDVRPGNPAASPAAQTLDVLQTMQEVLVTLGLDFRNIVRTWFYNDRILDWYADFNKVRGAFFERHGIALMPASTGVGVANPAGTALVAKAIAILPLTPGVTIRRVDSPLQCEASSYGSAFSRALEVADPAARILYISGTASIESNGDTAYSGDASRQIEKTMEVVDAILARNGMCLSDTIRAIGYFRDRKHISLWRQYCRIRKLPPIPILLTECDICRDNLLFEIEIDAAREV